MKTKTRILAEKIQAITGDSLIQIQFAANQMIGMGLIKNKSRHLSNYNREMALTQILETLK